MTDRDRETLTDQQMRARLSFYAEHYASFGEWPDTKEHGDALALAIQSLLERLADAERPLEELRVERGLPESFTGDEIKGAVNQVIEGLEERLKAAEEENRQRGFAKVRDENERLRAALNAKDHEYERRRVVLEKEAEQAEAEVERLRWQRDKAARIAGIDISELEEAADVALKGEGE